MEGLVWHCEDNLYTLTNHKHHLIYEKKLSFYLEKIKHFHSWRMGRILYKSINDAKVAAEYMISIEFEQKLDLSEITLVDNSKMEDFISNNTVNPNSTKPFFQIFFDSMYEYPRVRLNYRYNRGFLDKRIFNSDDLLLWFFEYDYAVKNEMTIELDFVYPEWHILNITAPHWIDADLNKFSELKEHEKLFLTLFQDKVNELDDNINESAT